jgi:hypothetical protein
MTDRDQRARSRANAKARQTDEAGLTGGDQSSAQQVAREKEGINQGWPRKEAADHKKKRVMKTSTVNEDVDTK